MLAAVAVNDVVPVTTSVPVCESGPPVVEGKIPGHRGGAQHQGIGVRQRHIVPAGDADGTEVVTLHYLR